MTLTQIAKVVATHFEISVDDMISKREEAYTRARHIWRVIAHAEFHFTHSDIGKFELVQKGEEVTFNYSKSRSAVYMSIKKILEEGVWENEYHMALNVVRELFPAPSVEVNERITDNDGITRVTQEAFDERFYGCKDKINERTGNNWFGSWHFLYAIGSPSEEFLKTYYKSKGFFSDFEFHRAQVMGSYVHNRIEDMGKHGIDTTSLQIYRSFPNAKEARRVEECLFAWLNFVREEEPQVLSYEQMVIAKDWGGTVDLRARIKSDNYKNVCTIDFKTSKSVYDSHKSQVESYRREFGDGKAYVLVLGNSTKKKYTLTEVKEKERDYFYQDFVNIKETAYHRLAYKNRLQPHVKDMPDVFSLKGLNITKI